MIFYHTRTNDVCKCIPFPEVKFFVLSYHRLALSVSINFWEVSAKVTAVEVQANVWVLPFHACEFV